MRKMIWTFLCIILTTTIGCAQKQTAKDTAFDKGSKITHINTDSATIENLSIVGMVWGFVKYYHPNVAKGYYNWDDELFRVLPEILKVKTAEKRDKILAQWIKRLGDFQEGSKRHNFRHAKMKPDLGWLTSSDISKELSRLLLKIKNAKRTKDNYYVGFKRVGNPDFKHEDAYKSMKYPDAGYRLLALYRYWNIVQYFYPYKYLIKEDWKKVLPEFIPKFIHAKNATEYTLTALQLIAGIHDTHANIWGNNPILRKYFGERYALPDLIFIDSKAVVKGFYKIGTENKTGLERGDIITKVNEKKVDEIVKDNLKIMPASNYSTQLRNVAPKLLRTNDSTINITYLHNGVSHKKTLKTFPLKKLNLFKKFNRKDTCFRILTPAIAYLYLGSIKSKYLPSIFKKIKHTKGLVIDLRCYPSDFIVYKLGKYLMPQKTEFVKLSHGSIKNPGLFTIGKRGLSVGYKNKNYYKGKVVILVNELTQSQAEFTAMAFSLAPNATIIGSTTAGADGDISSIHLPGGIATAFSGAGVYYPNGDETQRVGIIPDIVVKPTIEGIKNGKDEVLEKAIEIINE